MKTLYERFTKDMGGAVKYTDERLEARWKETDFGNKGGVTQEDLVQLEKMREAWQASLSSKTDLKPTKEMTDMWKEDMVVFQKFPPEA